MRLFYTLITSGLLILTEIPVEQPPPLAVYQDIVYAISHPVRESTKDSGSDFRGTQASVTSSSSDSSLSDSLGDLSGEWYQTSSPITYLGVPSDLFPIQAKQEHFAARQPPQVEGVRLQDGPELIPAETKAVPTPLAKATPLPTGAVASSTTANGALATYRQQSSLPISGFAMFYNPNVMQEVLSNRLAMGHISACGECIGNVALLRAGDLNRRVWLQWADGTVEGPFLVADVAASHHVAQLLARNWVVDVDNSTAVRRKMAGPVWVTVWDAPPIGNDLALPPFAPLYSSLPAGIPTVVPTSTPLPPALSAMPAATAVVAGLPSDTPVPTITPLPAINAIPTATVTAVQANVATQTPLPSNTPSPTATAPQAPAVTIIPTVTVVTAQHGFPTDTPIPTNTALPAINVTPTTAIATVQTGFPTDTPMPSSTPLPALSPSATQPATSTSTITATPTALPTATPIVTPTATLMSSPTVDAVVTQKGFPPDTPVPTVTPLPAINPLPTPTITPSTN